MTQIIQLDATTVLIKSDNEEDLAEIVDLIAKKNQVKHIHSFLAFAAQNRVLSEDYKFNRDECYDRGQ